MVGRISLLRRFSSICIPPAVWREVVEQGGSRPGAAEIREARESGWLRVVEPSDKTLVRLLKQELHAGEAESIALALEVRPDVLLLDETEARRVAGLYGLPVTGIIGLLIHLYSRPLITRSVGLSPGHGTAALAHPISRPPEVLFPGIQSIQ